MRHRLSLIATIVAEVTHLEGIPYSRKWASDDMQHVYAEPQERYVVILDSPEVELRTVAWDKERCECLICLDAVLLVRKCSAVCESFLRGRDSVVKPSCVDKGRPDLWMRCPKEVK